MPKLHSSPDIMNVSQKRTNLGLMTFNHRHEASVENNPNKRPLLHQFEGHGHANEHPSYLHVSSESEILMAHHHFLSLITNHLCFASNLFFINLTFMMLNRFRKPNKYRYIDQIIHDVGLHYNLTTYCQYIVLYI